MNKVYRLHETSTEIVVPLEHLRKVFIEYTAMHREEIGMDEQDYWQAFWAELTKE